MTNNIIRLSEKVNGGHYHYYRYKISDRKMIELWVHKGSTTVDRIVCYDLIGLNEVENFSEVTDEIKVYASSLMATGYEIAEALDLDHLLTFAQAIDSYRKQFYGIE